MRKSLCISIDSDLATKARKFAVNTDRSVSKVAEMALKKLFEVEHV